MKKSITKAELVTILTQWGQQKITTQALQSWMLDNFEPDEFDIGKGESEWVSEAMHIVMNEYELASESKCLSSEYQLSIDFLQCDEQSFLSRRNDFLRNAFCD